MNPTPGPAAPPSHHAPRIGAAAPTPAPGPHTPDCDVLVVGGGINGCGIARDLAGRG
ncbi:MAG: hypothetical protein RLZZ584_4434, partial [Pseudomonadota bacterium]